jgi:hypothetical protein
MQRSTLQNFMPATCLASDPKLVAVRERGTKAVVSAAKLLVGLSSSIGNILLTSCASLSRITSPLNMYSVTILWAEIVSHGVLLACTISPLQYKFPQSGSQICSLN